MRGQPPPLVVFVDPAAGHRGIHNLGFVDVLLHHGQQSSMKVALAAHRLLDAEYKSKLADAGVEVLTPFDTDAYKFSNLQPSTKELIPYTMHLAQEYQAVMQQVAARWPGRQVCWVFHTSPWQHLSALAVALSSLVPGSADRWQFHVYLMYWHGIDDQGVVLDAGLKTQYRQILHRLSRNTGMRFFTSTAAYLDGYKKLLLGTQHAINLHPFFLGDWKNEPVIQQAAGNAVKRVLAYCGDARAIKGFYQLPQSVQTVFRKFPLVQNLIVHSTRLSGSVDIRAGLVRQQIKELAAVDNRLVLQEGFLSHADLLDLLRGVDMLVLNYDHGAYEHKTSGFVWLAAQLGVPCALTANTWLEAEAIRLGVTGWRITDTGDWERLPSGKPLDVADYRRQVLSPYALWLHECLIHGNSL